MPTIEFYDTNSQDFFDSTVNADVSELYQPFVTQLPAKARVLDAGCGSGRDSKAFINMDYKVTAIDASVELAKAATTYLGKKVHVCTFEHIDSLEQQFDGIWACASLLHVDTSNLPKTFTKLADTLVDNGVLYCSFKYGDQERNHNGRFFTDANEARLQQWLSQTPLDIKRTWITTDVRPGRDSEQWLNAILIKNTN
ncbi:class I SAM-dependent methyltransferase [Shewanella frigidimarina]|uniref:class I SAM-dependent methyltransferase n=1 Tax=Shewanella frigidimarina TaxID=56812 RepID=UPI000F511205|nr:class I SAM-dependent methyltransferase [Shewanella frigidimarina]RPA61535.1 class I SAM-dependent methyltransferase [Shewanella frigidimarina]